MIPTNEFKLVKVSSESLEENKFYISGLDGTRPGVIWALTLKQKWILPYSVSLHEEWRDVQIEEVITP